MRTVLLREAIEPRNEIVHPRDNPQGEATFVGLEHIEPNTGRRIGSLPIRLEQLTGRKARFYAGDIVYGYLRPYLNKVWVADFDGYCSVDQYVFRPNAGFDAEFIAAFLRSPEFLERAPIDETPGQLPRIRTDEVLSVAMAAPHLIDQQRIVVALQHHLGRSLAIRGKGDQRAAALEGLRALLLRRVVDESDAPTMPLDEVAVFLDSRREPVTEAERRRRCADPTRARYPYYGANGQAGWIDEFRFDEPLVLLAEDGGYFGSETRSIAYRVSGPCWVNNHAHVLRAGELMDVDYLCFALQIRPDVGAMISGSTRGKLPRSVAGQIAVPVPPLGDQRRIAATLRGQLSLIDRMGTAIDTQREAATGLFTALQRRVFEEAEAA